MKSANDQLDNCNISSNTIFLVLQSVFTSAKVPGSMRTLTASAVFALESATYNWP